MHESRLKKTLGFLQVLVAAALASLLVVALVVFYQEHRALDALTCVTSRYVHEVAVVQCDYDVMAGQPRSPACMEAKITLPASACPFDGAEHAP